MKNKKNKSKLAVMSEEIERQNAGDPTGIPPAPRSLVDDGLLPPPAPGEFKTVPHSKVRPDPNQPRKTFDQGKLEELAASIRTQGIISPLVVQLMPAKVRIEPPDLIHNDWQAIDRAGSVVFSGNEDMTRALAGDDVEEFYQIVFGERRWRAAKIAGLAEVPVIVRELTEREVFIHQFIENQARENLTALEEAKSFAAQIAKRKETNPEFNPEKLAEELSISRGTVYNRLTLTRLTEPVLAALTAGTIQPTQAGLIAMIPDPKQQEKLLKKISDENDWKFPYSFRDIEELIEDEYCKQLKDAPFDTKVVLLDWERVANVHEFHAGRCTDCPMRTGNLQEAFPHIKNLNVCTQPACYQEKCKVHFADEAAEAERKGQKVLTVKEFKKVQKDYSRGSDYSYAKDQPYEPWAGLLGKKMPEPVQVVTEQGLVPYYPKERLIEVAETKGVKFTDAVKAQTPEERAKEEQKRKDAEARKERRVGLVVELAPTLSQCLGKLKDALAWELSAKMIMSVEWPDPDVEDALIHKAKSDKAKTLGKCFADGEYMPVEHDGDWNKENVALWKRAGVDLIEEEKKRENDEAPSLPLAKAKPQQKELLVAKKNKMSAAAKAKITAAARARWAKAKAKAGV